MSTEFVHLHVHTQYSLLVSTVKLLDLPERTQKLGMKAVAVTDHANMFGAVRHYQGCTKRGLQPILGCELNIARPEGGSKVDHLPVLAANLEGYRNLVRLVSAGYSDPACDAAPSVSMDLIAEHSTGLVALTGCMNGVVPQAILERGPDIADATLGRLQEIFDPGRVFVELQDHGLPEQPIVNEVLSGGTLRRFDKGGDAFYDQISALHKSVRGSNPDGALYWFCRMIDGGCDPIYIARRVVRMASEDIGNADPRGLQIALDAWQVQERLGSPEGELAIAQAIVYLSIAAKSNAVYNAYNQAMASARESGSLEVPLHLRNAPTKLMKELDYGNDYRYAHDEPGGYAAGERYLPDELGDSVFYQPVDRGMETKIREKLEWLRNLDRDARE